MFIIGTEQQYDMMRRIMLLADSTIEAFQYVLEQVQKLENEKDSVPESKEVFSANSEAIPLYLFRFIMDSLNSIQQVTGMISIAFEEEKDQKVQHLASLARTEMAASYMAIVEQDLKALKLQMETNIIGILYSLRKELACHVNPYILC